MDQFHLSGMKWLVLILSGMALTLAMAGCRKAPAPPPPPPPDRPQVTPFGHLDRAQPKLATIKVFVGNQELETELALEPVQRATGMMFRTNMPDNTAMLFVFPEPHRASFFMKNTVIPLSAAYISPDGIILEIVDLEPLNTTPVEAASDNVQYVLETPRGWFQKHNIGPGAVLRTQKGTLRQTFFPNR